VEQRELRVMSLVEWLAAALCAVALIWIISVPIQRALGPSVQAAIAEVDVTSQTTPPGVPAGATVVPIMLMLDGREIRQGDLRSKVDGILPHRFADGPAVISSSQYGERHAMPYLVNGVRFYVVCERFEPNGQMKVSGIYLP
jgi:hypothetical protein